MSDVFWANLIHLGTNLWGDRPGTAVNSYSDTLRCDAGIWESMTQRMADTGWSMAIVDVADGVEYQSHPDIAVTGAWSRERLREELARLRELGLEPIPKLNFSATHDAWLKDWSRRVGTPEYRSLARELISEVVDLFGRPRFLHLGMDEESAENQRGAQLAVTRQHDLWWEDLEALVSAVEEAGSRAWVWSDHAWAEPEAYYRRMPTAVVQSNWYYRNAFSGADEQTRPTKLNHTEEYVTYLDLDDHGYDQVPTASNWLYRDNLARTVDFVRQRVNPERVLGFMQTSWRFFLPQFTHQLTEAIDALPAAKARWSPDGQTAAHQGE